MFVWNENNIFCSLKNQLRSKIKRGMKKFRDFIFRPCRTAREATLYDLKKNSIITWGNITLSRPEIVRKCDLTTTYTPHFERAWIETSLTSSKHSQVNRGDEHRFNWQLNSVSHQSSSETCSTHFLDKNTNKTLNVSSGLQGTNPKAEEYMCGPQGEGQYWYSVWNSAALSLSHTHTHTLYIIHERVYDEGQCPVSPLELLTCASHFSLTHTHTHTHTHTWRHEANPYPSAVCASAAAKCTEEVNGPTEKRLFTETDQVSTWAGCIRHMNTILCFLFLTCPTFSFNRLEHTWLLHYDVM